VNSRKLRSGGCCAYENDPANVGLEKDNYRAFTWIQGLRVKTFTVPQYRALLSARHRVGQQTIGGKQTMQQRRIGSACRTLNLSNADFKPAVSPHD
jgi:hypothetical protein